MVPPVVGEVADGVNGIIYAARGDKVNAATAGKWVNKGAKAAKVSVKVLKKRIKVF